MFGSRGVRKFIRKLNQIRNLLRGAICIVLNPNTNPITTIFFHLQIPDFKHTITPDSDKPAESLFSSFKLTNQQMTVCLNRDSSAVKLLLIVVFAKEFSGAIVIRTVHTLQPIF